MDVMENSEVPQGDFPRPAVLSADETFMWSEDSPATGNYLGIGKRLAAVGDLYRRSSYASGLLLAAQAPNIPPIPIGTAAALGGIVADRVPIVVVKNGKVSGNRIPSAHMATLLASEIFLQQFRPIDIVTRLPMYLSNFTLTKPGYNDGGLGERIFYAGEPATIAHSAPATTAFLDAMPFASNADRTNAVGAALTVTLRNLWLGAKPVIILTANKSHAGKDTVIRFAAGSGRVTGVSYQSTDWALERSIVGLLRTHPDTAVLNLENVRLGRGELFISSGFLERLVMDAEPTLFSTGTGPPVSRRNDFAVAMSTNFGLLSSDQMNRALPIRLEATGSVEDRPSPIRNPKLEYLPAQRLAIDAELRGMIERWKEADRPLDEKVRHPFTGWAKTIGGILKVNGFNDFLANYGTRKAVDDPLRKALGLLGAYRPDVWLSSAECVKAAAYLGLIKAIVPEADRESPQGLERGMGVTLSAHRDEILVAETEDERVTLRLVRARRRFTKGEPSTKYRFETVARTVLPADDGDGHGDGDLGGLEQR